MAEDKYGKALKRVLFIYNPNAGNGKAGKEFFGVIDVLANADYELVIYRTKARFDAKEKIIKDGESFDRIVCFGGDGTLSEVVSGVMELENRPEIGFIPAGSTNDTAKSYNIPNDPVKAAHIAVNNKAEGVDVGTFNGSYFIYVASFGEISSISAFTPRELKKNLGHAAYVIEGIKVIPKMKPKSLKITYDDGEINGEFYLGMITNSYSVGGFQGITGSGVDLKDGLFEVVLFLQPSNPLGFAQQIDGALIHTDNDGSDVLIRLKTASLKIESDEDIQWVTDGEDAGIHRTAEIKNIREAVNIAINR